MIEVKRRALSVFIIDVAVKNFYYYYSTDIRIH